jgi:DNA polymerase-3 subunit epsilon
MLGIGLKRAWYRRKTDSEELLKCWSAPYPSKSTDWREVEFLVVDTETSSLSAADGEMLSIGWVVLAKQGIELSSSEHYLLTTQDSVGQSATIHQLRDCELVEGLERPEMMTRFLEVASGRILVFHHAFLDMSFLNQISVQLYGVPLLLPYVDTLQLEQKRMARRGTVVPKNGLRLANCRTRYNLPDYPAHNALVDALATAELLLAQLRHRGGKGKLALGDLF